jgi:hypothetical protein
LTGDAVPERHAFFMECEAAIEAALHPHDRLFERGTKVSAGGAPDIPPPLSPSQAACGFHASRVAGDAERFPLLAIREPVLWLA